MNRCLVDALLTEVSPGSKRQVFFDKLPANITPIHVSGYTKWQMAECKYRRTSIVTSPLASAFFTTAIRVELNQT